MSNTLSRIEPQQAGLWLLGILFIPATLFFQPNLGGEGMSISHNITVWIAAVLVISCATLLMLREKQFSYPRLWLAMAALPIGMIILGFIVENFLPTAWLFRQLYILGGFMFLIALFQFRFSSRDAERGLIIILIAGIVHGLYGVSQILWPSILPLVITPSKGIPYSIFQQINIHASFQATVLMAGLFLLSRPLALKPRPILILVLLASIFLSCFIVAFSGSRTGLLSAIAGGVILLFCNWRSFLQRKPLVIAAAIAIAAALFMGQQGIHNSTAKLGDLARTNNEGVANSGSNSRINIYKIAYEVFKQQPLSGHGIGSFQKVWLDQKVDYLQRFPDANLPPDRLSHPHNELMFWLVEGGLIAVAGILISVITVIYAAFSCGWRRGLSYIAMLIPIGLHTQVELPFYISNIPWFLMLFLIFIVLRHSRATKPLGLSRSAELTCGISAVALFLGVTVVMFQTVQANNSIIRFLHGRMTEPALLQPALSNPFFRDDAELYFMRTLLLRQLNARQGQFAPQFIQWATPYIEYTPIPQLYIDLSRAYLASGEQQKALKTIEDGQARYPKINTLNESARLIKQVITGAPQPETISPSASGATGTSREASAAASAAAPARLPETPVQ
ncbi:PglL family O-oligosaccharyltransferase [Amphritea pacifica]|uniref:O-antigen ligase C-terminal domain-containing protein n=1 Tax=Amphritea pacifica TaxID=2811233 RepID=A0ABS2W3I2_9GAMM|nr:Wzy polymerase domain-containing protein [Amphritea pacifica]MBN0986186.1 O-antigen ligase C-terminal domain-containing protein [Amphritea pacifica]